MLHSTVGASFTLRRLTLLAACCVLAAVADAQVIDFDTLPAGPLTFEGQSISNQYDVAPFTVSFEIVASVTHAPFAPPRFPVIAEVGPPLRAFSGCPGPDQPLPGQGVEPRFLTTYSTVARGPVGDLLVRYSVPVAQASAVIIDTDSRLSGAVEAFTVTAFDALGFVVDQDGITAPIGPANPECPGSVGGPGDGRAVQWSVQSPSGLPEIESLLIDYTGSVNVGVGLAFDSFSPASSVGLECDPRTQGFWKRQCRGPHPSGEHEQLPDRAPCVAATTTFSGLADATQICDELHPFPTNDKCQQAEAQLMALLLNLLLMVAR